MPWNIYNSAQVAQHAKDFHAVHYLFKYRYMLPALRIGERLLGSALIKEVPDLPHNANIKVFHAAWEKSIVDWNVLYRANLEANSRPLTKEDLEKMLVCPSSSALRLMGHISLTMALQDTAYREFLNIFCHNIARGMHGAYAGLDVPHLFYSADDVYDVQYYAFWKVQGARMIKEVRKW